MIHFYMEAPSAKSTLLAKGPHSPPLPTPPPPPAGRAAAASTTEADLSLPNAIPRETARTRATNRNAARRAFLGQDRRGEASLDAVGPLANWLGRVAGARGRGFSTSSSPLIVVVFFQGGVERVNINAPRMSTGRTGISFAEVEMSFL